MLCAARPASNNTGPSPLTRIATTRPAARRFSGTETAAASRSTRSLLVGTTNVHGCAFRIGAGQAPGVEQPCDLLGRKRRRNGATLVATAGDREQRVHDASL